MINKYLGSCHCGAIMFEFYSKKIVELTTNAVEKRLISDVPVGIFLSGGIDSGVISACLAELGEKIPHFTVGFNDEKDDYYNEMKTAEKITKYFGFEHHKLYLKAEKINPLTKN